MVPAGELQVTAPDKESLVAELRSQTLERGIAPRWVRVEGVERRGDVFELSIPPQSAVRALRAVVAIGRSGDFRRLGVPGEDLGKVYNRLHDPADFAGRDVLVVGGGDSALEAAAALAGAGARVTLSYRQAEWARPKAGNVARLRASAAQVMMASRVRHLEPEAAVLADAAGREVRLPNDAVFALIGREAPLGFLRRSGAAIRGEWRARRWASLALVLALAVLVYHWKSDAGIPVKHWFQAAGWFPFNLAPPGEAGSLWGTVRLSATQPGFHYSLAYSLAVLLFGLRRVRRHPTPYVRAQTAALTAVQWLPLFLLPYILLPWAGHHGWFDPGTGLGRVADALFPVSQWSEHGREYWRSMGLILAWPLFLWNVFTDQPLWAWLAIGAVQTFVAIPALVYFWGKGAYCGWICSCGALAETVGDTQRERMPHGPGWNRANMTGQVILAVTGLLLALRLASWWLPGAPWTKGVYMGLLLGRGADWASLPFPFTFLNYAWSVDLFLSGIIGVGLYWHFSGRVWCRFACPLAALMHVYARCSRFRILAEKERCISCNLCTAVCHQGIDVMSFANRGRPMADPQCVRCSACVESCPTGVLQFGQVDPAT
ncbi:MAG: NAD(P)-binding domain-containing protein, partial [Gemmatimonadota bacterium]